MVQEIGWVAIFGKIISAVIKVIKMVAGLFKKKKNLPKVDESAASDLKLLSKEETSRIINAKNGALRREGEGEGVNQKMLFIGGGVLAAAGLAYYINNN